MLGWVRVAQGRLGLCVCHTKNPGQHQAQEQVCYNKKEFRLR